MLFIQFFNSTPDLTLSSLLLSYSSHIVSSCRVFPVDFNFHIPSDTSRIKANHKAFLNRHVTASTSGVNLYTIKGRSQKRKSLL